MATLITCYDSNGHCLGICNERCYNATCDRCECICNSVNHGRGLEKARENTRRYAGAWIRTYEAVSGIKDACWETPGLQLSLF